MRLLYSALFLLDGLLVGQASADAIADRLLVRIDDAAWGAPYTADKLANCEPWKWVQSTRAEDTWSEHCVSRADGLIEDSFYYAFDDSGTVLRRVEVHSETPPAGIAQAIREKLSKRFGDPSHGAPMLEFGLFGPVDRWISSKLVYYTFQDPPQRLGAIKGPRLIVFDSRLFGEYEKDAFIQQADVLFFPDPPARPFLARLIGPAYSQLIDAPANTTEERDALAAQLSQEALGLLGVASRALFDERAMLFLAANDLISKLSRLLQEGPPAETMRKQLAAFGVKLGAQQHDGGLLYRQDLLWKVWREFSDSQAGQLAFLELQQRGWYDDGVSRTGCPANPDHFREVIERGEAFLAKHPSTQVRKEVLFTLAVANESWWSVAEAPADDPWVSAGPYPRKSINKQQAAPARDRAIRYYEEIVQLAPASPEAASARRRLPRLKLNLDTGQRRFFCSYD